MKIKNLIAVLALAALSTATASAAYTVSVAPVLPLDALPGGVGQFMFTYTFGSGTGGPYNIDGFMWAGTSSGAFDSFGINAALSDFTSGSQLSATGGVYDVFVNWDLKDTVVPGDYTIGLQLLVTANWSIELPAAGTSTTIHVVPEPGQAVLLGCAALVFASRRSMKKKRNG
jgi:hypothetical protein